MFCSQVLVDRTQYHPFLHPTPLFSIFFHFHGLEICKTAIICRFTSLLYYFGYAPDIFLTSVSWTIIEIPKYLIKCILTTIVVKKSTSTCLWKVGQSFIANSRPYAWFHVSNCTERSLICCPALSVRYRRCCITTIVVKCIMSMWHMTDMYIESYNTYQSTDAIRKRHLYIHISRLMQSENGIGSWYGS
jgi:hypothetical protein